MFVKFSIFGNVDKSRFAKYSSHPIWVQEDWGEGDMLGWWVVPPLTGSPPGPCWQGRAIPTKLAWGMLDPPLDPMSRFPFRKDWLSVLCASSWANEDDLSGPPSLRVGSSSSHGSGWPLMPIHWMWSHWVVRHPLGLESDAATWIEVNAQVQEGRKPWGQIMYAHQPHYLWGLSWGYCSEKFQSLW